MNSIDYLRQFRLGGFAIFDFAVSFLGMLISSPLLSGLFKKMGVHVPKRNWVILTLPIGVAVHILVGTITPLTKDVLNPSGNYVAKIIILVCMLLGLTGIRRINPLTKVRT